MVIGGGGGERMSKEKKKTATIRMQFAISDETVSANDSWR